MNKSTQTAYIDLLSALFAVFLVLFAVKSAAEASRGNMSAKAEFIVTLDWRDASLNDIDLWVKGPEGLIFFKQKNAGSLTLDHIIAASARRTIRCGARLRRSVPSSRAGTSSTR